MGFFMNLGKDISSEILVIYGLITFVVGLIIFTVFLDKKDKKKIFLTKTQELRLMDLRKAEDDYTEEFKRQKEEVVLNVVKPKEKKEVCLEKVNLVEENPQEDFTLEEVLLPEENKGIQSSYVQAKEALPKMEVLEEVSYRDEDLFEIDETQYIEDDLEKTSAQIQLEILAKELEKAKREEEARIQKFESAQEENAIISYKELLKVSDTLYDQNEKVQYLDEGNEPINLEELRSKFQSVTNHGASTSSEIEIL